MKQKVTWPLKVVLALMGAFIVLSGTNIGLGGINTLGLGGQKDFFEITKPTDFQIQDSHVRFVGGLWLGIGLFLFLAISNLPKYKPYLYFAFALIFLGGILRLFQGHPETTFHLPVVGSLAAEIIGMPLLYYWVSKQVD